METYRQLGERGVKVHAAIDGVDGYAMVKTAMTQLPDDAGLQFAAALITNTTTSRRAREHLDKARAMAKSDALVARNMATHFTTERGREGSGIGVRG